MDKKRQKIYELLNKLIGLREGTTFEGEKIAAEKAIGMLLTKYGLELSKYRDKDNIITKDVTSYRKRRDGKEFHLYSIIAKFCGV